MGRSFQASVTRRSSKAEGFWFVSSWLQLLQIGSESSQSAEPEEFSVVARPQDSSSSDSDDSDC